MNNLLLPVLRNESPFNISLSDEDLEIEDKLFSHFGGRTASPSGKLARMGRWVMNLLQEKDKTIKRAGFLALWLSKFLFSEYPGYRVKSVFFPLTIKLARNAQYPLAPMFLGHVYSQLDLLHGETKLKATLATQSPRPSIVPFSRYLCGTVLQLL